MLIWPTERVVGAEEGLQRGSLQLNRMEVQDLPKQTAMSSKPRPHRLCQVGRHRWIALKHLLSGTYSLEHVDQEQGQVSAIVRSPLQNHDQMDSGRKYCLLTTIHEATSQGCRALSKLMWNPASIADMMSDDLDLMEMVVLDHITAILYIGRQSASEGLTEEEAQACINHFSPYIEWRDMAVEHEFQALTLAEAQEEIRAYEARSHRSF